MRRKLFGRWFEFDDMKKDAPPKSCILYGMNLDEAFSVLHLHLYKARCCPHCSALAVLSYLDCADTVLCLIRCLLGLHPV
jgi:hypothetical protein